MKWEWRKLTVDFSFVGGFFLPDTPASDVSAVSISHTKMPFEVSRIFF